MTKALELPLEHVEIRSNDYLERMCDPRSPLCALAFPYSQHFVIKQDLPDGAIRGENDLRRFATDFLAARDLRVMSGDDIKKPLFRAIVVSALLTWGFMAGLLFKILAG